ncbi:MAG: flagellar hook-basal body complex protein [Planctomycetota bacterium]
MALIRSLNTAVTGLRAQQFRIETVGNNIANVDTTAFKGTRVDFSTLLSQTMSYGMAPQGFLGGIDPVQIGLGTQVASTTTNFNQGPTEATGVNTDLAIQGDGFFVLNDAQGGRVFTRDGSFTLNPSSLLHDPSTGYVVQGWMADENFQVVPGGPLQDVEIQVGTQTIARPTSDVSFGGNLDASGDVGGQGTLQFSDMLFDDRFSDDSLISGDNPLGLARATADTPMHNLVRSLGDFVAATSTSSGTAATSVMAFPELAEQLTGVEITLSAEKGERILPERTFVVGDPPPTGGTTLGDFMDFLQGSLGVNDGIFDGVQQTEHAYSYARTSPVTGEQVNGTLSVGVSGGPDDSATLSSMTDFQADFTGVRPGDFIRFTSGAAAGQIAQITSIGSSTPGGNLDTLVLRDDGFNSLSIVPATGDTYVVHAPAGVSEADDITLLDIDSTAGTVTVGAPSSSGGVTSFTVSDTAFSDLQLEEGVRSGLLVQYESGGAQVSARVLNVSGDTVTIGYPDGTPVPPDAGTTFTFIDQANGTIELAGNAGVENDLGNLELISAGARVPMFDNPPAVRAEGESMTMNFTVYDSLGSPRDISLTFVFEGSSANGPNTWRYFAESVDDSDLDRVVGSGTVIFGDDGQFLTTGEAAATISINLDATPEQGGGVETPFTFELDFSRLTQFTTTMSEVQMRDQDGFESGTLRDFAIGEDGSVMGVFSNGLSRLLAQVPVSRFTNPNGLQERGNSMYTASVNSGTPQIGVAGTFGRGTMASGVLEESNVDLAEQFTDLIVGQRAFQANARTISVSDEMLQELVNLV